VSVAAALPFPLRIVGGPYPVATGEGTVELSFRTERHDNPDQRVHGGGSFDFEEDRYGWASYSHVNGELEVESPGQGLGRFVEALNVFIACMRDVLNLHWIHPVEPADLFQLTISSAGAFQTQMLPGRAKAVTLPIEDLAPTKKQMVLDRVKKHQRLQTWRSLELDACEAFATSRFEQCAVLAWSAVEAAVRGELPRLARAAGLTPADVWAKLGNRAEKGFRPLSHEQAVEDASILDAIVLCAELCAASHDAGSLAQSGRAAYDLRNRVAHQGYRVAEVQAQESLDATRFILQSLALPTWKARGGFELDNWLSHFGSESDLQNELGMSFGRIILFAARRRQDPLRAHFELRIVEHDYIATIPADIEERVAAALLVLTADSYRPPQHSVAFLKAADSAKVFLVAGLLDQTASDVTQAVRFAHAGFQRMSAGMDVRAACDYGLRKIQPAFATLGHSFNSADARFVPIAARFASLLLHASADAANEFLAALAGGHHAELAHAARGLMNALSSVGSDPSNSHWTCLALRSIHGSTMWLDSIVVICPEERMEYGTSARPLANR